MLTIHSCNHDLPLFWGRLLIERIPPTRKPTLAIRFWEPAAHTYRTIEAPDQFPLDGVLSTDLPELHDEATTHPVNVALDPDSERQSRDTLRHFHGRLSAWRSERIAAGDLASLPRYQVPRTGAFNRT